MTPREIRWYFQYVSLIPASTFAASMRSLPYRRPSLTMPGAGAARCAPQKQDSLRLHPWRLPATSKVIAWASDLPVPSRLVLQEAIGTLLQWVTAPSPGAREWLQPS
jgi:hypothetical protein